MDSYGKINTVFTPTVKPVWSKLGFEWKIIGRGLVNAMILGAFDWL